MASELWAYKKAPAQPQTAVISSDDDDDDPLLSLPANNKKRRRLPARLTANKPINLDSDEDEAKGSQQSEQAAAVEPPATDAGPSDFDLPRPQPPRRRSAVLHDECTQRILDENKRAMAELQRAAQDEPDNDAPDEEEQQQPQQQQPEPANDDAPRVLLFCRTQRHGHLKLRLRCGDPLSKLVAAFRLIVEQRGWIAAGAELRFEFDGDQLTGEETPAALDMEDDDSIEVTFA